MTTPTTDPRIEDYVRSLLTRHDEPVLLEMEAEAGRRGFPIVGRMVGVVLEILARSIGAKRVFEMGSGFGYSAYWFSRAIGPEGTELYLTDGDPNNERMALDFLHRAGLDGPVRTHVGDAVEHFNDTTGEFDIVFSDIDKQGYPAAWEAARERIRLGGLYLCDNTLGFGAGRVIDERDGRAGEQLAAIRRHNELVAADGRYVSSILPIRDGVLTALRIA
ncbi:MAG TPA: O-methyltransferase [Actinobacteria bacterium]|jgi:predicted O-methyltransferase YrrM|nr:O-methyltransferase [Actinomycetota bacterium]HCP60908.1 O-methyltransferase [Actinomycetota bacterium]